MKSLFLFLALFSFNFAIYSSSPPPIIPEEFAIKQKTSSLVTIFYIEADAHGIGKVIKETTPNATNFYYKDDKDQLVATGQVQSFPTSAEIQVWDHQKNFLGTIRQEVSAFFPKKYALYDAGNQLLAKADMNWLGSRFVLTNPKNAFKEYAIYSRPYFKLYGDYWYVKIVDTAALDPRFIVIIAAFQTDLDYKNTEVPWGQ